MFLEISQNSQKNTSARDSFLTNVQALGLRPATLLKKNLWRRYFPVNFAKFLRTLFLENTSWRMLLYIDFSFFRSRHQCFSLIKLLTAIPANGLCTCIHILYISKYINIYKKPDKTKVFRKRPIYLLLCSF